MSEKTSIDLTACLLVYNHAHLLPQVLSSILKQTYKDFSLVISDDCSTDNSYEIAKSFESLEKRVSAVKTTRNLGMAANANYAVSHAKSKYIALLHHDDILSEYAFQEWLQCIESNEKIGFVFNDYSTEKTESSNHYLNNKLKYTNSGNYLLKRILLRQWGSPVRGTALIRRKCFLDAGGLDEKFGMLADVDLWMRLASGYDVGYVNKPLIKVLENRPDNYPKDYTEFSWKRIFILFDIHANNINRDNFSDFLIYKLKRFIFRNKVSFEIIKWHIYALVKSKKQIIISFPEKCEHEYFYSKVIRSIIKMLPA